MIVVRFLVLFILTALLTGCIEDIKADIKAAKEDVKAAKADIRALRSYIMALPPPNACLPPGEPQARICYYKLSIKVLDKQRGLFKGYVSPELVKQGAEACQKVREEILKDYPTWQEDYKCPDVQNYAYVEYGFKIDGAPSDLKDGVHDLYNIPRTEYLKLGKPEGGQLAP